MLTTPTEMNDIKPQSGQALAHISIDGDDDAGNRPGILLALSGGGAKGLGHIGVLRSLADTGVEVLGYAGTSAGAIVAALAAAGYDADELVDVAGNQTIFDSRPSLTGKRPSDLIGGWVWLRRLTRTAAFLKDQRKRWLVSVPAIAAITVCVLLIGMTTTLLLIFGSIAYLIFFFFRGIANLEPFRAELNAMIAEKLGVSEPTFDDLARLGRAPLKVVAANLSTPELEVFSAETTPSVCIADAVVASASIPIVFQLETIYMDRTLDHGPDGNRLSEYDRFCDGGIVSNLPAWLWDEERSLLPTALTVAVEIAGSSKHQLVGRLSWLKPFVATALFGSGALNLRASGKVARVRLATDLGLLEFDASRERVLKQVESVYEATAVEIRKALIDAPALLYAACENVRDAAEELLAAYVPPDQVALEAPLVARVALLTVERGLSHSLRLEHEIGFETRPGDRLLIRTDRGAVARAWQASAYLVDADEDTFSGDPAELTAVMATWRFVTVLRSSAGRRVGALIVDGTSHIHKTAFSRLGADLVEVADSFLKPEVLSLIPSEEFGHGN